MARGRVSKREFQRELTNLRDQLLAAQSQLETDRAYGLILLISGAPTSGRSEVINDLLEWLDPKFIRVHAFGEPDKFERLRPAMWRYWRVLPPRGRMALLHTGWYVDVFKAALDGKKGPQIERAAERIRQLETMLQAGGTRILKIHLDVDAKLQRVRLAALRADKLTSWRVTAEDKWFVKHHRAAGAATNTAIGLTNTAEVPWQRVDATDEEYRLLRVGKLLLEEMQRTSRAARTRKHHAPRRVQLPIAALPALDDNDYERELKELQGRLALAVRRAKFRKHAQVLAFYGIDAAGKGGSIRRLTRALDARQ
jgi:polyphosphate kinase 2 (PPK2 family)